VVQGPNPPLPPPLPLPFGVPSDLPSRLLFLQDPLNFLRFCVFTQDEVDVLRPVKPAPVRPDLPQYKPYLEPIVRIWQSTDKLVVDKSRRMWISWLFLSLHLHYAFTNTNRRVGIVSKKFEDACAHLRNMKFIYDNIPDAVWPKDCRPKLRDKEGFLFFDELESTVHALASGPDQARQYGFSKLFFDEMDFWPEAEATFGAAKPTLQGGGGLTVVSTHAMQDTGVESFYKRLIHDEL
jgi:hypothetical protein